MYFVNGIQIICKDVQKSKVEFVTVTGHKSWTSATIKRMVCILTTADQHLQVVNCHIIDRKIELQEGFMNLSRVKVFVALQG